MTASTIQPTDWPEHSASAEAKAVRSNQSVKRPWPATNHRGVADVAKRRLYVLRFCRNQWHLVV
jgi:hypothetical protein